MAAACIEKGYSYAGVVLGYRSYNSGRNHEASLYFLRAFRAGDRTLATISRSCSVGEK